MVLLNKKKIKEISHTIAPYLPYPIASNAVRLINKGYVNWIEDYIFNRHIDTTKALMEKGCLFIHIPKCGGNSIYNGLLKMPRMGGHLNAFDYQIALGKHEYDSRFKFTFVRNPWDRVVSAYFFELFSRIRKSNWFVNDVGEFDSFDDFCKNWVTSSNIKRMQTFRPQTEFITIGNEIKVDFIGKCETMKKDMKYVADHIGVDLELRRDNRSKHPDYRELYTSKSKDIVFQVYREDIKKLKYEF
jgi:hypothetical protein